MPEDKKAAPNLGPAAGNGVTQKQPQDPAARVAFVWERAAAPLFLPAAPGPVSSPLIGGFAGRSLLIGPQVASWRLAQLKAQLVLTHTNNVLSLGCQAANLTGGAARPAGPAPSPTAAAISLLNLLKIANAMSRPFYNPYASGPQGSAQAPYGLPNAERNPPNFGPGSSGAPGGTRRPLMGAPAPYRPEPEVKADLDLERSVHLHISRAREEVACVGEPDRPLISQRPEFANAANRMPSSYRRSTADDSSGFFPSSTREVLSDPGSADFNFGSSAPPETGRPKYTSQSASDILVQFGLEKDDLDYLARFPEDQITTDNLPFILRQILAQKNQPAPARPKPSGGASSCQGSALQPTSVIDYGHTGTYGAVDPTQRAGGRSANSGGGGTLSSANRSQEPRGAAFAQGGSAGLYGSGPRTTDPAKPSKTRPGLNSQRPDLRHQDSPELRPAKEPAGRRAPAPRPSGPAQLRSVHPHRPGLVLIGTGNGSKKPGARQVKAPLAANPAGAFPTPRPADLPSASGGAETFPRTLYPGGTGPGPAPAELPAPTLMRDYAAATPSAFPHTCSLCVKEFADKQDWLTHQNSSLHLESCRLLRTRFPQWNGAVNLQLSQAQDEARPSTSARINRTRGPRSLSPPSSARSSSRSRSPWLDGGRPPSRSPDRWSPRRSYDRRSSPTGSYDWRSSPRRTYERWASPPRGEEGWASPRRSEDAGRRDEAWGARRRSQDAWASPGRGRERRRSDGPFTCPPADALNVPAKRKAAKGGAAKAKGGQVKGGPAKFCPLKVGPAKSGQVKSGSAKVDVTTSSMTRVPALKSAPPTMVRLEGVDESLSHGDVVSAAEMFGKTKSVVLFRKKLAAMVCFEREEDARRLKSLTSVAIRGIQVWVVGKKAPPPPPPLKSPLENPAAPDRPPPPPPPPVPLSPPPLSLSLVKRLHSRWQRKLNPGADVPTAAPTAPGPDSRGKLTIGEMIGGHLSPTLIGKVKRQTCYTPEFLSSGCAHVLLSGLPPLTEARYTEQDVIKALPLKLASAEECLFVLPQAAMAFAVLPSAQSAQNLMLHAKHNRSLRLGPGRLVPHVMSRPMFEQRQPSPLGFYRFVMGLFLLPDEREDEGERVVFIRNISADELTELRVALGRIQGVCNILPLLNKVFIEFESGPDADRLGVWLSLLRRPPRHRVVRLKAPPGSDPAPAPSRPEAAVPAEGRAFRGAAPPKHGGAVPSGTAGPFWVMMANFPFLFPTVAPWFNIPEHQTVRTHLDLQRAQDSAASRFCTVMLTGLPDGTFRHQDLVDQLPPPLRTRCLRSLYYDIIVLTLQRRAFVRFSDWPSCLQFLGAQVDSPVCVGGSSLTAHLVLEEMDLGSEEELMFQSLMKWSNAHVVHPESVSERLLCVETSHTSADLITLVLSVVASTAKCVSFLPLANRICLEMLDARAVSEVERRFAAAELFLSPTTMPHASLTRQLSCAPLLLWAQVARVEGLKNLKRRLDETRESAEQNQEENQEQNQEENQEGNQEENQEQNSSDAPPQSSRSPAESGERVLAVPVPEQEEPGDDGQTSPSAAAAGPAAEGTSAEPPEVQQNPVRSPDAGYSDPARTSTGPSDPALTSTGPSDPAQTSTSPPSRSRSTTDSQERSLPADSTPSAPPPPQSQSKPPARGSDPNGSSRAGSAAETEQVHAGNSLGSSAPPQLQLPGGKSPVHKAEPEPRTKVQAAPGGARRAPEETAGPEVGAQEEHEGGAEGNQSAKKRKRHEGEEPAEEPGARTQNHQDLKETKESDHKPEKIQKTQDRKDDARRGGPRTRGSRGVQEVQPVQDQKEPSDRRRRSARGKKEDPEKPEEEQEASYQVLDSVEEQTPNQEPTVTTRSTRGGRGRSLKKEEDTPPPTTRRRAPARESTRKDKKEEREELDQEATYEILDSVEEEEVKEEEVKEEALPPPGGRGKRGRPMKEVKTTNKEEQKEEEEPLYQVVDSVEDDPVQPTTTDETTEEEAGPKEETAALVETTEEEEEKKQRSFLMHLDEVSDEEFPDEDEQEVRKRETAAAAAAAAAAAEEEKREREKTTPPESEGRGHSGRVKGGGGAGPPGAGPPGEEPVTKRPRLQVTAFKLPPFEPGRPLGQEFVVPKSGFFCNLCRTFYLTEVNAKNTHCASQTHYDNLQKYYQKLRQKKLSSSAPKSGGGTTT